MTPLTKAVKQARKLADEAAVAFYIERIVEVSEALRHHADTYAQQKTESPAWHAACQHTWEQVKKAYERLEELAS